VAHKVEIKEAYRDYQAPAWVRPTVERILEGVPDGYLSGLRTVVLTAAGGLSHDRRRGKTLARGKKVKVDDSLGLYHRKWKGEPAWIELFVDNIVDYYGGKIRLAFFRDFVIGEIMLHEVGHHIHATKAPEHKEREDVADRWSNKLLKRYLMRRYWYFFPLFLGLCWLWESVRKLFRLRGRKHRQK
jgi:hypothetical protein